jgi:hypothetical protein
LGVAGIDEAPETTRAAVRGLGREEMGAVVAPVAGSRELGDGHQLDGGDPQIDELWQMRDDGLERARAGEGADM